MLEGDRLEVRHSDEYEAENEDNLSAAQAQVEAECNPVNP